jgi:hypothetical protein
MTRLAGLALSFCLAFAGGAVPPATAQTDRGLFDVHRVERVHRSLEHDGDVVPAQIPKSAFGAPVNVLALAGGPSVAELTSVGVRRVSTGGALAFAAYGALVGAARELRDAGTSTYVQGSLSNADRETAFAERG